MDKSRVHFVCTDLTVAAGGTIETDAKGWACGDASNVYGYGPGAMAIAGAYAGGSHGGLGSFNAGVYYGNAVRIPDMSTLIYGSPTAPETHGSGGYSAAGTGGAGGGVVRIEASGCVTVNGAVRACGRDSKNTTTYDGGGAGGSIYITCKTFAGAHGRIRARGGLAHDQHSRAFHSGGGGRVAIIFDTAEQALLPVPKGMEYSADCGPYHAPDLNGFSQARFGSLYFPSDALIDTTGATLFGALDFGNVTDTWEVDAFRLTNGWATLARESVEMHVKGSFEVTGKTASNRRTSPTSNTVFTPDTQGTRWDVGGASYFFSTNHIIANDQYSSVAPRLTVDGDFKVSSNGIVQVWSAREPIDPAATAAATTNMGAKVTVAGAIKLIATGKLYARSHPITGASPVFTADSVEVDETSYIHADAQGYWGFSNSSGTLATEPQYMPLAPSLPNYNGGGGHGGKGGYGYVSKTAVGDVYDCPTNPVLPGCGSCGHFNDWHGPRGGGVVRLHVANGVTLNGAITANGGSGHDNYAGGGAGGSVLVACRTFAGAGRIEANGGAPRIDTATAAYNGGGGGGGRISVHYDTSAQDEATCSVVCSAAGGRARIGYAGSGHMGTVYFSDNRYVADATPFKHTGMFFAPALILQHPFTVLDLQGGIRVPEGGSVTVAGNAAITGADRRSSGLYLEDGSFSCGGTLSLKAAHLRIPGGDGSNNERFKVGGATKLDDADLEIDFAPEDLAAKVDFNGLLELTNGAVFRVTSPRHPVAGMPGVVVTAPDVTLHEACWIQPYSCFTNGAGPIFTVAGTVRCATNCGFDASAAGIGIETVGGTLYGYDGETLDGRGLHFDNTVADMPAPGHGGTGGLAVEPGGTLRSVIYPRGRGQTYDSERKPVLTGLPGAGNRQGAGNPRGGGGGRIEARRFHLNGGELRANGGNGGDRGASFRAGASGGSVYVRALTFTGGGGTLRVRGGDGSPFGSSFSDSWSAAAGGGGRIAIWKAHGDENFTIDVAAGNVMYAVTDAQRLRIGEEGTYYSGVLSSGMTVLIR